LIAARASLSARVVHLDALHVFVVASTLRGALPFPLEFHSTCVDLKRR
jgi:hypothetical protein